jgi:hypothetical protein
MRVSEIPAYTNQDTTPGCAGTQDRNSCCIARVVRFVALEVTSARKDP